MFVNKYTTTTTPTQVSGQTSSIIAMGEKKSLNSFNVLLQLTLKGISRAILHIQS